MTGRAAPFAIGALLVTACSGAPDGTTAAADPLPVLTPGEPVLEIGVVDGPEELVFAAIESAVRLPGGLVAVSDGGATRISLFEPDGTFLRSWGRRGDGPGEFRSLSRIYPHGADSLLAGERYNGRLAVFDLEGELGRLQPGADLSGDSVFTLDSWLHGRFWIDGALTRAQRGRTQALLDDLVVPSAAPGYRYGIASEDGALWLREPGRVGAEHVWTRIGGSGAANAVIRTPVAFRPTQIRGDELLGVWSDETGVHFVRGYVLAATGERRTPPDWIADPVVEEVAEGAPSEDELMAEIRSTIKNMASHQEMHYAGHMSYTTELDSLERFEQPENIRIDFMRADARGWAGVFTSTAIDRVCALAYGFGTPPGWMPGSVVCAPDVDEPTSAEGS